MHKNLRIRIEDVEKTKQTNKKKPAKKTQHTNEEECCRPIKRKKKHNNKKGKIILELSLALFSVWL